MTLTVISPHHDQQHINQQQQNHQNEKLKISSNDRISSVGVHRHVIWSIVCFIGVICCWSCLYFVAMCFLLHFTNTHLVHEVCPGLWDFVLYAFVFPMLSPILYVSLQWSSSFTSLTTGCSFGLSLLGAVISLKASTSPLCVETLRATTPPLPWLLFMAWMKTLFFLCTLVAALKPQH
jgi:hypothetical protein